MADFRIQDLTDIGEDLADDDAFEVQNASSLTNSVKSAMSRIWTYVLAKDGAGSGLDADLLDGQHAAAFESAGAAASAQSAAEATAAAALTAHEADTTAVHGIADTSALLDSGDIGSTVQAHSAVLDATTASFTTADETKLDGIEAAADVTDAENVSAAGAPIITSGAGAPSSTPSKVGDIYVDTTGDTVWSAAGTASSADWKQATGAGGGDLLAANNLSDLTNAATARTNLGVAIGTDVQAFDADLSTIAVANNGSVLAATTASFTTADETKLDGIEANATADQTAADIRGLGFFDTSNDGAGSGLDADTVDGVHAADLQYPTASEDETGTTYTFVAGDQNKIKTFTNASAVTATVDGSVHSTNDRITVRAGGAGGTTLVEGTGMTFDPPGSVVLAEGQVADLIFTSATTADAYVATAASATEAGIVELADGSETSAGSDALRAVTPDGLAASRFGAKDVCIVATASDVATAVGNGDIAYCVPASLNGMNLTAVVAAVHTAGTTGTTDVQVRRRRDTTDADMLTTKITIDSGETRSTTAATAAVINGTNDDVATGDLIFVDVDAIATTPANGLFVTLTFSMP